MDLNTFNKKISQELEELNHRQLVSFAWRCAVRTLPFLTTKGNFNYWTEKDRQKYIYSIFHALDINAYADAVDFKSIDLKSNISQDLKAVQGKGDSQIFTKMYGELWNRFQKALEAEGCGYWGKLYKSIFDKKFVLDSEALERRMNVPQEIQEQGASDVADYLEKIEEQGGERLNEARIIILGDKGSGKTCLARKLMDPQAQMTTPEQSTAGVDVLLWKLNHENINVRIWDFAGHTVTHAVHQFFLSERSLYIIVCNGRTEEENNRLKYWLNHMKNYGGNSKAIILVNKRDVHTVGIPINTLKDDYSIEDTYTFSIKDDEEDLNSFRQKVADYISNNPSWNKQEIPKNYFQVKEDLEKLFSKEDNAKEKEHITKKEFEKIAKKHDVDDIEKLLEVLHVLGVSLWYKDMEKFDNLVLNPEWISHGVYKVINWVKEKGKYGLTLKEFKDVFRDDDSRYPVCHHEFLFDLMKRYELAYETENEKFLIIPHLLKEDRPKTLSHFPVGESLMLRYKSDEPLLPHTISRFIVQHHEEIKKKSIDFVWRFGVLLEDDEGNIALVQEKNRIISVFVKGQSKTNYISKLRETLNGIFNSYKNKNPELQYRIDLFGQIPNEVGVKDLWLQDEIIAKHHEKKKAYWDAHTDQDIPMDGIVIIYNIKGENIRLGGHKIIQTKNTFNFHNCNIGLQSNLNKLAQYLTEGGNTEEANKLKDIAKALKEVEQCDSKEKVKKKGIVNRIERLVTDLGDEKSKLHKSVEGIKNGISIAQDIAKGYNDVAQWFGLPQVPKPFLKNNDK